MPLLTALLLLRAPANESSSASSSGSSSVASSSRSASASLANATATSTASSAASTSAAVVVAAGHNSQGALVLNEQGDFNGSCSVIASSVPDAAEGSCAGYIPDVTSYCCAAVGGNLTQIALPDGTGSPQGVMGTECESSAYSDMLQCFQYTSQNHCSHTALGPYGICNPVASQIDTSRSRQGSHSGSHSGARKQRSPGRIEGALTLAILAGSIALLMR